MRAVRVSRAKGPLELVEQPIPEPGPGSVRIKVEACGICHSDVVTKEAIWPGLQLPRVPGHEVAGVVDAVGARVARWSIGQRVGVGWHGGHCGYCDSCRRGDFVTCQIAFQTPGIAYDGGYADYMIAPAAVLASIPEALSAIEAAPLMCAGVTTFNALRHSGAVPGDTVAVLGIGGLGDMGGQFASKRGVRAVATPRGGHKAPLAPKLCAPHHTLRQAPDAAAALARKGG